MSYRLNEREREQAAGSFEFSRNGMRIKVHFDDDGLLTVSPVQLGRHAGKGELWIYTMALLSLAAELYHERLIRGAFAPTYTVRTRCETTSSYDCNCVGGSSKPYGWHPDLGEVCAKCNGCKKKVPCNRPRCLDCNGPTPELSGIGIERVGATRDWSRVADRLPKARSIAT